MGGPGSGRRKGTAMKKFTGKGKLPAGYYRDWKPSKRFRRNQENARSAYLKKFFSIYGSK